MAVSDQMEMALNESERQDPVSGNDVPMGSLPEEVRDDVPAMLSEGEYVVPADVLRFYGLKFFEDLRTDAKVQIAQMADEGRIGGEPIAGPGPAAPTPDQPNGLDLSPEDMQKLESVLQASEGGAVGFQDGGLSDVLKENEEGGLPTKKVGMDVDKDTDMLIDRIMNSVQKNPMIKEKLAARGIGFMNGGDVQGYYPGGAVDYINVAKNYKPSFDPFDPDFGLGMYSSGLMKPKTASDIQEQAGVSAPRQEVKKRKEQPDGPDDDKRGGQTKSFSEMTGMELSESIENFSKFKDIPIIGKFVESLMINPAKKALKEQNAKSGTKVMDIDGKKTYTSTKGISKSAQEKNAADLAEADNYGGFTGSGAETGAENYSRTQYGGSGEITGLSKGGFISRRKKT